MKPTSICYICSRLSIKGMIVCNGITKKYRWCGFHSMLCLNNLEIKSCPDFKNRKYENA
jgi:hypothetical protein